MNHSAFKDSVGRKFPLGQVVMTRNAMQVLRLDEVGTALANHAHGDWGDVCPEDRAANERALANGGQLFSVYHDRNGVKFWIITEHDRSATTVLLPEDY
jgi:hypothetical protein